MKGVSIASDGLLRGRTDSIHSKAACGSDIIKHHNHKLTLGALYYVALRPA